MNTRLMLAAIVVTACAAFPVLGQTGSALTTQFNSDSIRISGLKPRKSAAVVIVSRSLNGYLENVTQISNSFTDDDGDGAITVPMPHGVSSRTVVVAVDELTGDYVISTPQEQSRPGTTSDHAFRRDSEGRAYEFHLPAEFVDMLLVRPGAGSWFSGGNGYVHILPDGTHETGVVLAFSKMSGRGPAPDKLVANDVCIVVNIDTLEAVVLKERK